MNVLDIDYYQVLEDIYKEHHNIIVAFDFDNTVFDYHKKKIDYTPIRKLLLECEQLDFSLICFTSNVGPRLEFIKGYVKEVIGITDPELLFNNNVRYVPHVEPEGFTKPYFNILLDDKAGLVEAYNLLNKLIINIKTDKIK